MAGLVTAGLLGPTPASAAPVQTAHSIPYSSSTGGVTMLCYDATGYSCTTGGYNGTSGQFYENGWTSSQYWAWGSGGTQKHNCTTYAAFKLEQNGVAYPGWTDNANGWANDAWAHGTNVDQTPAVGAIAEWNGGSAGHVAYVEDVTSSFVEFTSDNYGGGTNHFRISYGSNYLPDNYIHFHDMAGSGGDVADPNEPLLGVVMPSGGLFAKDGGLSTGWVDEAGGVKQVAVASDAQHGPLIAFVNGSGEAFAKEGGLSAGWVDEYGGVKQVAVASDSQHGPLIAVLSTSGEIFAKEGGLSAGWVDEAAGATQVAVASDAQHGPLIAFVNSSGEVFAKEGGLSAGWVDEWSGAHQVSVSSDSAEGPLIAVLSTSGEVFAKEGGLSAGWVDEAGGAKQVAVASDAQHGPLIAFVNGSGEVFAKEGGLSTGWVDEWSGAREVTVSSDPAKGPLIAVLTLGAQALAKEGGLSTAWVNEMDASVAVATPGTTAPYGQVAPATTFNTLPTGMLSSTVHATWRTSASTFTVESSDVRYERAPWNAGFGGWVYPSTWQRTTASAVTLPVAPGYEYCFESRARDVVGNLSAWTSPRCTTRALDDRSLGISAGLARGTGRSFYMSTVTATTRVGASLTRAGTQLRRVGLVATKCARCGAIAVYVGSTRVGVLNLYRSGTAYAQVLWLPVFGYRTGTVTIRVVTSGKIIQIDGLFISRT